MCTVHAKSDITNEIQNLQINTRNAIRWFCLDMHQWLNWIADVFNGSFASKWNVQNKEQFTFRIHWNTYEIGEWKDEIPFGKEHL